MIMKKILFLLFFLPTLLSAQVKFQDITFDEAQKKAQKEGKAIFIDVYRSQPEKSAKEVAKITKEVLSDKELSSFLQKNFVFVGIDMSKEENSYFGPFLYSLMYPCVAFYTDQGVQLEFSNWHSLQKDKSLLRKLADKSLADAQEKKKNSRKVAFKNLSFEDALALAKKENKMVFIDAFTDWCRPCKLMELHVFSLDRVADFYNENFIPLKIDFGKERPDLAKKYEVKGYPSFLFINADGDVVHTAGGYQEAEPFIEEGKKAIKKFDGIEFHAGTWSEALAKAKKENKLIFLDCYAQWCGPCKVMAATTFKDPVVAELFNETFVNVKIDMEKGEGVDLKKKFAIRAYPTLLFIDGDGNVVHKVLGGLKSEQLLKQAARVKEGKGLAAMTVQYDKGNVSPGFIKEYIEVLGYAGEDKKAEVVVSDYLATMDKSKLKEQEYWDLFEKYITDVNSDLFIYVFDNKQEISQSIDEARVNSKLNNVWIGGAYTFVKREGDKVVADKKGLDSYIKRMKKAKVKDWENIAYYGKVNFAEGTDNWKEYTSLISKQLKKNPKLINDMMLYNYGLRVNQKCEDTKYRLIAAKWMDDRVGEEVVEKQEKLPEGAIRATSMVGGSRFKEALSEVSSELKQPMKTK